MNKQRYLLVVSGPSGCGKDTVVQNLLKEHDGIKVSVSATTRTPRQGEVEGVHYHFVTRQEFEQCIKEDDLLEYAEYVGNYYGTLRSQVNQLLEAGITCILIIEVQGAEKIKKMYPDCTTVFIKPPSMEELRHRLKGRGTDSDEWVEKRMKRAEEEMAFAPIYDYSIINDDAKVCAQELYQILKERQAE